MLVTLAYYMFIHSTISKFDLFNPILFKSLILQHNMFLMLMMFYVCISMFNCHSMYLFTDYIMCQKHVFC